MDKKHDSSVGLSRPNGTATSTGSMTSLTAAQQRASRLALLSMLLLVFQGSSLSILLRYSRVKEGTQYLGSVSVLLTEGAKLAICLAVQLWNCRVTAREESVPVSREFHKQAHHIIKQSLPMLLPAGMFVMQQVLLIVAATHLDAVAFQIFSQSFKLLPTAVFAYWLLGQQLEPIQWASIPVLAAGVILVTLNNAPPGGKPAAAAMSLREAAAKAVAASGSGNDGSIWERLGWLVGMVTCSISGLSSAYAGVYFEKYVKGKHAASLWVRNIQLGIYGVPLSTAYMMLKDGARIREKGALQGFDLSAWLVVALQVFGGLVTGMVVKYCDNILKNFALAISVILTVLVVIPLFGQWPSGFFLVGVALVLLSVFMYGKAISTEKIKAGLLGALKKCSRCLPWAGEDGHSSRQLLTVFLLSSLTAGTVVAMYGLQRLVLHSFGRAQPQWQATVATVAKQGQALVKGKAKAAGGMRGAGSLLKQGGRVY